MPNGGMLSFWWTVKVYRGNLNLNLNIWAELPAVSFAINM